MNFDLMIVFGVISGIVAIPVLLNAYTEGASPRKAIMLVLLCVIMLGYVAVQDPAGLRMEDVPDAFIRVIAEVMR